MKAWIRLGLVITALWVGGSFVAIIYMGQAPNWRAIKDAAFADWQRRAVEAGTGLPFADWERQVRAALDACAGQHARTESAERGKPESCKSSTDYDAPPLMERIAIVFRSAFRYIADWCAAFLFPIAIWSFFLPFGIWMSIVYFASFLERRGRRRAQIVKESKLPGSPN